MPGESVTGTPRPTRCARGGTASSRPAGERAGHHRCTWDARGPKPLGCPWPASAGSGPLSSQRSKRSVRSGDRTRPRAWHRCPPCRPAGRSRNLQTLPLVRERAHPLCVRREDRHDGLPARVVDHGQVPPIAELHHELRHAQRLAPHEHGPPLLDLPHHVRQLLVRQLDAIPLQRSPERVLPLRLRLDPGPPPTAHAPHHQRRNSQSRTAPTTRIVSVSPITYATARMRPITSTSGSLRPSCPTPCARSPVSRTRPP